MTGRQKHTQALAHLPNINPNYRQQFGTILEKKTGPLASLREYMVLVEDVTDQRRAEERLRRYARGIPHDRLQVLWCKPHVFGSETA